MRIFGIKRNGNSITLTAESIRNLANHYMDQGHIGYFVALYNAITAKPKAPKKGKKGAKAKPFVPQFASATYTGTPVKPGGRFTPDFDAFEDETGEIIINDIKKFPSELFSFLKKEEACEPREYAEEFCNELLDITVDFATQKIPMKITLECTVEVECDHIDKAAAVKELEDALNKEGLEQQLHDSLESYVTDAVYDALETGDGTDITVSDKTIDLKDVKIG